VFVKIAPKSLEPLGLTRNVALTDETLTNGAKESTISRTLSDKDESSKTKQLFRTTISQAPIDPIIFDIPVFIECILRSLFCIYDDLS